MEVYSTFLLFTRLSFCLCVFSSLPSLISLCGLEFSMFSQTRPVALMLKEVGDLRNIVRSIHSCLLVYDR
jgi:hypothetical protein